MVEISDGSVLGKVAELTDLALSTYTLSEGRVEEDANGERRIHQGGYGDRQIFELVQNAADEMRGIEDDSGRVHVVLTDDHLYCANEGLPITPEGAETILRMGVSRKRGGQIGRFGVGVKAVLSVTRTPQFFSSTGAFGFDADWAAERILTAVNEGRVRKGMPKLTTLDNAPVLRLAKPLDVVAERRHDRVLDEQLDWAVTVVRLPLLPGASEGLGHDIQQSVRSKSGDLPLREFPHLFQVFSSHVGQLVLEDRRRMPLVRREISVVRREGERTIREVRAGAKALTEEHRVFVRQHTVDDEVRRGAGELHDRVTIDISWAVPKYRITTNVSGQTLHTVPNDRGAFWAYFPTTYPTTLSGVLNAAWKTNEDRQNLLQSPFNNELLRVAADLVVGSLGELVVAEDPGAYLPLLPGRTRESPNWACAYLTGRIWQEAAIRPSLPDQDGRLRPPADLNVHPEKIEPATLELWRSHFGRPRDWVHHSVEATRERRGKVTHVLDAAGREPATIRQWLEALVSDGTAAGSAAALKVLAALLEKELIHDRAAAEDARQAKILLTERNGFVSPVAGSVFRRTVEDSLRDDLLYIHRELADDAALQRVLDQLGIREADAEGRFRSVLDQGGFGTYSAESWTRFWELMRTAGPTSQVPAIKKAMPSVESTLKVRTVAGGWRPIGKCLLVGAVVPGDGSRDADVAIDQRFHADDRSVLLDFAALAAPVAGRRPEDEPWFDEYQKAVYDSYVGKLKPTDHRPALKTVRVEGSPIAGPMSIFLELSPEGKAAFLSAIPDEGVIELWTRQIGKSAATREAIVSPIRWLLRKHGWVATSKGVVPVREAVSPELTAYRDILPVAEISPRKAARLRLPKAVDQVQDAQWADLLAQVKQSEDDAFIGRTYALLVRADCGLLRDEDETRCRVGDRWELRPDTDIAIAFDRDELKELVKENHPALLVERAEDRDEAEAMIAGWGMRRVSDVISKRVRSVPAGSPVALVDEYPPLRQRFGSRVNGLFLQRCAELEEVVHAPNGTTTTTLRSVLHDRTTMLVDEDVSYETALELADVEFGWNLGAIGCRSLLDVQRRQQQDLELKAKLNAVRQARTVAEKISLLIGEDDLRAGLPAGLLESEVTDTGREPDARRVAEMAYHAHGDEILRHHQKDLQARIPTAPARFDGDQTALRFVASLDLPDSFAGARVPAPPARECAAGPVEFPRLHDYQEIIAARVATLLRSSTPRRAMLSLPTGAGKTRVAAEGVIRWIRDCGMPAGPILWVAQTGELCEQAVQSWKFVWEKVGPKSELVIDRLWSTNSATRVTDRPHLVIATDAKLSSILGDDEYAWLRRASLVLTDEAHVAISKEYTAIFEKLGLTHRETTRHLIGLTATPFRNNETTTERLVARFGNERLDKDIFAGDAIPALQGLGVLSTVEHRELTGAELHLRPDELTGLKGDGPIKFLPKAAEQRLSEDQVRNKILLDEIVSLPADWPILVFATSVHHAKFLAAKLGDRGIRAAAIDSSTPPGERRRKIDGFRDGRIRVITNYGVLSQGFDAPATRAVVIARPVYSANTYQQMIGRGLRGRLNGGEDTCLILDVRDNISNFSEPLAFTDFEHLWQEGRS